MAFREIIRSRQLLLPPPKSNCQIPNEQSVHLLHYCQKGKDGVTLRSPPKNTSQSIGQGRENAVRFGEHGTGGGPRVYLSLGRLGCLQRGVAMKAKSVCWWVMAVGGGEELRRGGRGRHKASVLGSLPLAVPIATAHSDPLWFFGGTKGQVWAHHFCCSCTWLHAAFTTISVHVPPPPPQSTRSCVLDRHIRMRALSVTAAFRSIGRISLWVILNAAGHVLNLLLQLLGTLQQLLPELLPLVHCALPTHKCLQPQSASDAWESPPPPPVQRTLTPRETRSGHQVLLGHNVQCTRERVANV